jgi:hypothetical protein
VIEPKFQQLCLGLSCIETQSRGSNGRYAYDQYAWFKTGAYGRITQVAVSKPGGKAMKRVELTVGDKTIGGTLVDFETVREEYNSYRLSDGSMIRMKTVVTNIIRTDEFTPNGEPIYVVNSQNVLVADVPDDLKKPTKIQ